MFSRKLKMKFKFYVCNCSSMQYGFMIDLLWWDPAVFSVGHFWPFLLTVAECFVTPHYQLALGGRDKPPNTQAVFVSNPGACCNIGYPSELKTGGILFACKLLLSCQIILKFCTEHGSGTAVLCANFQNDLTSEIDVLDEWGFMRFEFRMSLDRYPILQLASRSFQWPMVSTRAADSGQWMTMVQYGYYRCASCGVHIICPFKSWAPFQWAIFPG